VLALPGVLCGGTGPAADQLVVPLVSIGIAEAVSTPEPTSQLPVLSSDAQLLYADGLTVLPAFLHLRCSPVLNERTGVHRHSWGFKITL